MELGAPNLWESMVRLVLALVFSAAIGWERELKGRPAGLRTHILVAIGATGFTLVALALSGAAASAGISPPYDPGRILSTIVGGIGFLGAGAILHSEKRVHGLTTAASIWAVAAIGMACGCGLYGLTVLMTLLCLVTLMAVKQVEKRWFDDADDNSYPEAKAASDPDRE